MASENRDYAMQRAEERMKGQTPLLNRLFEKFRKKNAQEEEVPVTKESAPKVTPKAENKPTKKVGDTKKSTPLKTPSKGLSKVVSKTPAKPAPSKPSGTPTKSVQTKPAQEKVEVAPVQAPAVAKPVAPPVVAKPTATVQAPPVQAPTYQSMREGNLPPAARPAAQPTAPVQSPTYQSMREGNAQPTAPQGGMFNPNAPTSAGAYDHSFPQGNMQPQAQPVARPTQQPIANNPYQSMREGNLPPQQARPMNGISNPNPQTAMGAYDHTYPQGAVPVQPQAQIQQPVNMNNQYQSMREGNMPPQQPRQGMAGLFNPNPQTAMGAYNHNVGNAPQPVQQPAHPVYNNMGNNPYASGNVNVNQGMGYAPQPAYTPPAPQPQQPQMQPNNNYNSMREGNTNPMGVSPEQLQQAIMKMFELGFLNPTGSNNNNEL